MKYTIKIKESFGDKDTEVFKFDSALMPLRSTWASNYVSSLDSFDELMEKIKEGKSIVMYADVGNGLPFLVKEMVNQTRVDEIKLTARGKSHGFVGKNSVIFKNVTVVACIPIPTPKGFFQTKGGEIPQGLFQLCTFDFEEAEKV